MEYDPIREIIAAAIRDGRDVVEALHAAGYAIVHEDNVNGWVDEF